MFFINLYRRVLKLEKQNAELSRKVHFLTERMDKTEIRLKKLEYAISNPQKYKVGETVGAFKIISAEVHIAGFAEIITNPLVAVAIAHMLLNRPKHFNDLKEIVRCGNIFGPYWRYKVQKDVEFTGREIYKLESELDAVANI